MDVNVYNTPRAVTMHDIAREAGVSVATVSRFINNEGAVGEEKSRRIRAAIEKFDYTPNRFAKGLKISRSMQIMLIVPDIKNPYYARLYDVLQSIAHREKYVVILYNTNESEENEFNALRLVAELGCDGVVFCSVSDGEEILKSLQKLHRPIVSSSGFDRKLFDTVHGVKPGQGVYLGTRYLLENGHQKVAFAGGNPRSVLNDRRMSGYRRAMQEAGLPVRTEDMCVSGFRMEEGYARAKDLLQARHPDGIFCATDAIAIGAMQACRELGLRVGEDVLIAGVGDTTLGQVTATPLTTAHLHYKTSGQEAAQLLLRLLSSQGAGVRNVCLGYEIMERASTGIL